MCRLLDNFDNKGREVCYKVSLYKYYQRQSCNAINAFRVVSIYWQRVAPFPWYLNAKEPTPVGSTWRRAVLSANAGLLLSFFLNLSWTFTTEDWSTCLNPALSHFWTETGRQTHRTYMWNCSFISDQSRYSATAYYSPTLSFVKPTLEFDSPLQRL